MEFGKRHDTADKTDLCPRQLVTDYVADLLRENWCNGFWLLCSQTMMPNTANDQALWRSFIADNFLPKHPAVIDLRANHIMFDACYQPAVIR